MTKSLSLILWFLTKLSKLLFDDDTQLSICVRHFEAPASFRLFWNTAPLAPYAIRNHVFLIVPAELLKVFGGSLYRRGHSSLGVVHDHRIFIHKNVGVVSKVV